MLDDSYESGMSLSGYWNVVVIDSIASWDWSWNAEWFIPQVKSYHFLDFHKPYYIININSRSKPLPWLTRE